MKSNRYLFLLLILIGVVVSIQAQTPIRIAADSSSGTYKQMLTDIISVCNEGSVNITMANGVTGGAPGNLNALVNNQADAAFLHSDIYTANAQADPSYANIKTLVALFPEQIHVLVKRDSGVKPHVWSSQIVFNSLTDLRGYTVGAAGGGVFTARILNGQGQGGFQVHQYDTGAQVIDGLNNGEVQAAVFVGAFPLPNISKLDKNIYKLVPIGEAIANQVTGVYRPSSINYPGLTNGPIKTLAPVATLMTRQFTTPAKIAAQAALRSCFAKHLAELQDGYSRNWQDVQPGDTGTLNNYLNLPNSGTAVPATNIRRKR